MLEIKVVVKDVINSYDIKYVELPFNGIHCHTFFKFNGKEFKLTWIIQTETMKVSRSEQDFWHEIGLYMNDAIDEVIKKYDKM